MNNRDTVAVIGLGYVGLPLASLCLSRGHTVYGVDLSKTKIDSLHAHRSYLSDFTDADVQAMFAAGRFHPTTDGSVVAHADAILLCVPTPLDANAQPDLSYVIGAVNGVLPYLHRGQLVVLESSTYPGTTEEVLLPLIESTGLKVGLDISLAFSPERIDPGQTKYRLHEIPKVVGGVTPNCTAVAERIYKSLFEEVVVVSSAKAAEMTKLLENSQRFVNISFMNELAILCDRMNINLWEVVQAASTKPYGFTPYYPGPGIGGHCIPVDPLYLLWKAKSLALDVKFIELAHEINEYMPNYVVQQVIQRLAAQKPLAQTSVFALGVTYKKDVNDMRESTPLRIVEGLHKCGVTIAYHDPFIEEILVGNTRLQCQPLSAEQLQAHDCTLILTDHSNVDYALVLQHAKQVFDMRNATGHLPGRGNVNFGLGGLS